MVYRSSEFLHMQRLRLIGIAMIESNRSLLFPSNSCGKEIVRTRSGPSFWKAKGLATRNKDATRGSWPYY